MSRIGWTQSGVTVANTNRDGSGTLVLVMRVDNPAGQFIDTVTCHPLGTNVATVGVLIGTNGQGLSNARNNFLLGAKSLEATTLGTHASTDDVSFQIGGWFDFGYEIYALVHDAQAAGRQFVAWSDSTYQQF